MPTKKQVFDFIYSFSVFTVVLFTLAVLSIRELYESAFLWDNSRRILSIFGMDITICEKVPDVINRLLSFNDVLFGRGFSDFIRYIFISVCDLFASTVTLVFEFLKTAAGAK